MELGEQIKKHRNIAGLSQEALAERIYVSRQTISNWETSKNYPDINSLIRLSEVFGVSVDDLLKGDAEVIKQMVKQEDINDFTKMSRIYTILLFLMLISPVPLLKFLGLVGIGIWAVLAVVTVLVAIMVEKKKKNLNIQTFREIDAFLNGQTLDQIEAAKEEGKRPYQKILLAIGCAVIALVVAIIMGLLLK
ncbi:MAG: helix-turn-helix transcriptional regulator [Clostridiales bacterium]|nr:helix-turn-helix transcriptional regulator [Clostridiales bacterium]